MIEGQVYGPSTIVERKRLLGWWLRSQIDPEEAEGMVSAGYKSFGCGGCARRGCPVCDVDPVEQVRTSRRGASADPRFVAAIVGRLSRFPAELVLRAQTGMAALPPDERYVLTLVEGGGLSFEQVARHFGISRPTVSRTHQRAIENLVALVWPPETQEASA